MTNTEENKKYKGYKYRIYPNEEQKSLLAHFFGCIRFVYNLFLGLRIMAYNEEGRTISQNTMIKMLKGLKQDYTFLQKVDSIALQQEVIHLCTAYKNFFEGTAGFPKFKKKHNGYKSYTTMLTNNNIRLENGYIRLPILGEVKISLHRTAPSNYKLISATVSQVASGEYYVSLRYEYDNQDSEVDYTKYLGLDYSSEHLFVDSTGFKLNYPRYYRQAKEKLAREQRKLSKMQEDAKKRGQKLKDCKNYQKQKVKVAKIHQKVANCRKDLLHKLSYIIAENYDVVGVEDINLRAISQTLNLGKSTYDNGFGMFRTMLEYKLADRGKKLIFVDKFFPSTQLCNKCGYKNPATKDLHVKNWECPICGTHHDRDINAAINIRNEAKRLLTA